MTLLSIALLSPLSWAGIGAPLANHLWQSTVFAGAVWLLTLLLRKNNAQSRYVLWLVASAKFLLPFSLLVALGSHLGWSRTAVGPQPRLFIAMESIGQPFEPAIPVPLPSHAAPGAFATVTRLLPVSLLLLWSVGCLFVLFMWYLRWRRLTALRRASLPSKSGRELEALRRVERTTRFRQQIDLVLSQSALEPGILGVLRSALLLPAGISEKLTDAQLESVIAHELCHVRRRDNLAAGFHMLVEAGFWFHPLVWWMGARLVEERERACDEEVLRLGADPHVYAEGILKVCKFYLESPLSCAAGVTGSNLKKRIEAIMTNCIAPKLELGKKLLLSTLGVTTLLGPIAFGLLHTPQSRAEFRTSNPSISSAFELASLQPSRSGDENTGVRAVPGRLTLANWTVKGLAVYAYNTGQIQGGPDWVNSQKYDINLTVDDSRAYKTGKLIATNVAGRFPPGLRHDQLMSFIQSLLRDRFMVSLSHETKQLPVYDLVIARNGSKLREATVGDSYPDGIAGSDGLPVGPGRATGQNGHLTVQALPMSTVAQILTEVLGRTVRDKTGLTGQYDFSLEWTPSTSQDGTNAQQSTDSVPPEPAGQSIFTAVQEQLGLKLESQQEPVEVLVIDHAEQVTGDESSQAQPHVQSAAQSRPANAPVNSGVSLTCTFAGVKYPEGTVIKDGNGPEQLCARVLDRNNVSNDGPPQYTAEWIHTNQSIRERSRNIVHPPEGPPAFCTPKPSTQSNLCSCQESGFFSENLHVDSAQGKLSCKKGQWVPVSADHAKQETTAKQAATSPTR